VDCDRDRVERDREDGVRLVDPDLFERCLRRRTETLRLTLRVTLRAIPDNADKKLLPVRLVEQELFMVDSDPS